ncbi:MAG TPA: hypothetical protein PLW32_14795 [Chitinophagaceae bacterium]|jgi:hypothetical protein|nr:hypothetical protein [Chitinophagaceae bacterium]
MKTYNRVLVLIIFIMILLPVLATAQPGFGDDVEDVPIDGGLSLLLAAGVGYGAKKVKEKYKKNKHTS